MSKAKKQQQQQQQEIGDTYEQLSSIDAHPK
jgi:hypothetical protein